MKPLLCAGVATIAIGGVVLCQTTADRRVAPIVAHKQLALIIGNAAYRGQQPLVNPQNDAQAMSRRLRELGFDVNPVMNADRKSMGKAIDQFVSKLATGDVAVFYYSGHGMQVEGENYLIPVDFEGQDESDAKYDGLPASRIQEHMEKSGAQLSVLIFDACRNNPYHTSSRGAGGGLAAMSPGKGTFIAFAAAPGSTASDNPGGRNGLFTQCLLEALSVPGLNLNDVFDLVREKVDTASGGRQLPWALSSVVGRYSFIPEAARAQAPVSSKPVTVSGPTSSANIKSEERAGAATAGSGLTQQAEALVKEKRFAEAFPLFERACAASDQNACISLGWTYIMGSGTGTDEARGLAILKRSCDIGSAAGCTAVGSFYYPLKGFWQLSVALPYFAKGCDGGDPASCGLLAQFYREGFGVEKNLENAKQFYKKACSLGLKSSCEWLEREQ